MFVKEYSTLLLPFSTVYLDTSQTKDCVTVLYNIFLGHFKKIDDQDEIPEDSMSLGSKRCVFVNDNLGTLRLGEEDRQ